MYVRSDGQRKLPKDISIPQNYSGNAFISKDAQNEDDSKAEIESVITEEVEPEAEAVCKMPREEKRGLLSGLVGNEDFLLLGLILLLSQDGFDDDILPIILLILFLKK